MTTKEVAEKLVGYCRNGQFENAMQELYDENIVSFEAEGTPNREVRGIQAVIQKGEQWNESMEEFHGVEVSDPIVADNYFSCTMKMDITPKGAPRSMMEEVCLYKVQNGKIVREEFFYSTEE